MTPGHSIRTRILATLCKCCPFCIVARRRPDSRFARTLREIEQNCPACRAYRRVHGRAESDANRPGN